MKQSEAVIKAVMTVTEEGYELGGPTPITDVISKEERAQVVELVTSWIESGDCDFSNTAKNNYPTTADKRGYVRGMVGNWFRKSTELNGGVKYTPKNPGSRVGSSDKEVKAIRGLIKSGTLDDEGLEAANEALEKRLSEIKAEKSRVEIDVDALPDELKGLVNN